jgi:hypothetical protein
MSGERRNPVRFQNGFVLRTGLVGLAAGLVCLSLSVAGPPDSEVNPVNCEIYTVSAEPSPSRPRDANVTFTIDPGPGLARSTIQISSDPRDDLDPKLTVAGNGDAWVTWWRDVQTPGILVRSRDFIGDSWSEEVQLSLAGESSRNPEIIFDGLNPWVAYEIEREPKGSRIAVVAVNRPIHDAPDPVGCRHVVDETEWEGETDVRIHFELGALWITWVHDASRLGWSLYDPYSGGPEELYWSEPAYVPYSDCGIEAAREWIRYLILEGS